MEDRKNDKDRKGFVPSSCSVREKKSCEDNRESYIFSPKFFMREKKYGDDGPKFNFHYDPDYDYSADVGRVFFIRTVKGHKENILLPENFNLEELIAKYPPYKYGFPPDEKFKRERIYLFLSLLSTIPARNSDLIDEDGFVPIHMATIRDSDKFFTQYKDYLIETKVIVSNGQYFPGLKSTGYKWSEQYENVPFILRSVETSLTEDISAYGSSTDIEQYPYLFHWYNQNRLVINPVAEKYAWFDKERKMNDKSRVSWGINRDTGKKKYPVTQYNSAMLNIGKLGLQQYQAHIDYNVHRLHSVLTNLQKEYRNFITYKGQNLISIDVKNCQPYLACLILNPQFWDERSDLPLKFSTLPENVQNYFPTRVLVEIIEFFKKNKTNDFQSFIRDTSSGGMYEEIVNVANSRIEGLAAPLTRGDAKTLMFYMLFSSNQGKHDNPQIAEMKRIFESELYPQVAELFKIIKRQHKDIRQERQHNRLAVVLQAIESQIILHRCCKRIWEETDHEVPVFTIHDSMVTTAQNVEYVKSVMMDELGRCIGEEPTLSVEEWQMSNLDPDILAEAGKSMSKISQPSI